MTRGRAPALARELDASDLRLTGETNAAPAVELRQRDLVLADAELEPLQHRELRAILLAVAFVLELRRHRADVGREAASLREGVLVADRRLAERHVRDHVAGLADDGPAVVPAGERCVLQLAALHEAERERAVVDGRTDRDLRVRGTRAKRVRVEPLGLRDHLERGLGRDAERSVGVADDGATVARRETVEHVHALTHDVRGVALLGACMLQAVNSGLLDVEEHLVDERVTGAVAGGDLDVGDAWLTAEEDDVATRHLADLDDARARRGRPRDHEVLLGAVGERLEIELRPGRDRLAEVLELETGGMEDVDPRS